MKQCACRFCLQVLTSEQLIFPVVHGTPYSGYDAREHTHSAVADQDRGLVQRLAGTEGNAALCKSEAGGRSGRVSQLPRTPRHPGRAAGDG